MAHYQRSETLITQVWDGTAAAAQAIAELFVDNPDHLATTVVDGELFVHFDEDATVQYATTHHHKITLDNVCCRFERIDNAPTVYFMASSSLESLIANGGWEPTDDV